MCPKKGVRFVKERSYIIKPTLSLYLISILRKNRILNLSAFYS